MSFSIQSFRRTYNTITYIHGAFPLAFPTPCWFSFAPLCVPFVFPSTYLAPSSCDRNRPRPSQVACKLTPFAPPFTQLTHPSQIPRTPPAPRLTMTTSGIFRLLLFGTSTTISLCEKVKSVEPSFKISKAAWNAVRNHYQILYNWTRAMSTSHTAVPLQMLKNE